MKTNKRRLIGIVLIVTVLGLCGFFALQIACLQKVKAAKEKQMDTLPDYCFVDLTDAPICTADFPSQPLVVVLFSPGCESCGQEIAGIYEHKEAFANVLIAMVTTATKESCEEFCEQHKLFEIPNLKVLRDSTGAFMQMANVVGVPESLVYNADKQLVKRFMGEVKAITLLEYLRK